MKVILFFAVFALVTQAHLPEVTQFYMTFINNIPMDVQTKARIMNEGLNCLNLATEVIIRTAQNILQDIAQKNILSTLSNVLISIQALEQNVFPKCTQTYVNLMSYFEEHGNLTAIDSNAKARVFEAKLIQLSAKVVIDTINKKSDVIAKDLAILVDTAFGLIDADLPHVLHNDESKHVPFIKQKAIPQFTRGFLTVFGITDVTKINAASQCAIDVIHTINSQTENAPPTLEKGNFLGQANAFLDLFMTVSDAFERCQSNQNIVDLISLKKFIEMFKQDPLLSLESIITTTVLNLSTLLQTGINIRIYMLQGQYEVAGSFLATTMRKVFDESMF